MIQRLDQGIIATFKMHYRKNLMLIIGQESSLTECVKGLTLSSMFDLAEKAWNSITAQTIQKCWYRGLAETFSSEGNESDCDVASNQIEADTDVEHCEELFRKIGIEDKHEWLHIDDDCPTYNCLTNHDIVTVFSMFLQMNMLPI